MTTEEQFWAAVNWLKTLPDPRAKLLASQAALVGDMREALWICVEHNALHFGERHNTVVQGRAALAGAAQAAQGDALPREEFAWMVVQEACETEPADEDDPECIRILRRDLKSAVLAALLRNGTDAARSQAKEGDPQ